MRCYIEEWLERQLKQATDKGQHAVANISIVMEDILETVVVDNINEMTATRK
jgi:hypothetical protein